MKKVLSVCVQPTLFAYIFVFITGIPTINWLVPIFFLVFFFFFLWLNNRCRSRPAWTTYGLDFWITPHSRIVSPTYGGTVYSRLEPITGMLLSRTNWRLYHETGSKFFGFWSSLTIYSSYRWYCPIGHQSNWTSRKRSKHPENTKKENNKKKMETNQ